MVASPKMTDELTNALIYRLVGAIAGAALAHIIMPPRTRRGFVERSASAIIFGFMFAGTIHYKLDFADNADGLICASGLSAFLSWQLLHAWKRTPEILDIFLKFRKSILNSQKDDKSE